MGPVTPRSAGRLLAVRVSCVQNYSYMRGGGVVVVVASQYCRMAMPPPFLEAAAATTIYGDLSPNETPKSTADSIGYAREQRIFCRLPLALASSGTFTLGILLRRFETCAARL